MSLLFYRRPDYVRDTGPMDSSDYLKYVEKCRRAIPPELCFDNVVANRAMPVSSKPFSISGIIANPISRVPSKTLWVM